MKRIRKASALLLNLARIASRKPIRLSHVVGTALAASEEVAVQGCDLLELPQVTIGELHPPGEGHRITLQMFPSTVASISPLEFVSLILLMKKVNARNVFKNVAR